ncbi:MAG: protein kinase [Planctomycetes bacterium]|nr:protein kinase [Planctomycetota bacterium]
MNQNCPRCGVDVAVSEVKGKFDGVCPKCLVDSVFGTPFVTTQVEKAAALPPIGGEFGNYHILGVLGSGGMGVVYKARQKGLERVVALKVLPAGDQTPGEIVERFFREARAAAKLCHPNIVPVYEVSSQEGSYFYSMELVEGRTLSEHLKGKPLGAREAVEILEKVARAIQYAHENGVIHRDLKPQNVMVDARGKPRVLDFGIAKTLGTKSGLTDTGSAMGTPPYMSPEQAAGSKSVDARSDVYSLGALLYEILTGRPPFTGETAMEIFRKIATQDPVAPRILNPRAPKELEVICLKALSKERTDRYATASAFAEDLRRHLNGEPIAARPMALARRALRTVRRHQVALLLAPSVVLLAAGVYFVFMMYRATRSLDRVGDKEAVSKDLRQSVDRAQRALELARFGTGPKERKERHARLREAVVKMDKAIAAHPKSGEAYYWRGRLHESMGLSDRAQADWSRALELDPKLLDARYRRARMGCDQFIFVGHQPERMAPLEQDAENLAAAGAPREQVLVLQAYLELNRLVRIIFQGKSPAGGHVQSLRQSLDEALRLNPIFVDGLILRSLLADSGASGDLERKAYCDRAAAVDPNDPRIHWFRFGADLGRPDLGAVLIDLEEWVELCPTNPLGYGMRAVFLGALRMDDSARTDLDAGVLCAPESPAPYCTRVSYWLTLSEEEPSCVTPEVLNLIRADAETAVKLEKEPGPARNLRARLRRTLLADAKGAEEDEAALGEGFKNRGVFFEGMPTFLAGAIFLKRLRDDDEIRDAALSYARHLVGRIRQGADRAESLPRVVEAIDRAFQCGAKKLGDEFDLVKDEDVVRRVLEKHRDCSVLTYKILYPAEKPKDAERIAEEIVDVLRRRIRAKGLKEAWISLRDDEFVTLRIPEVRREEFEEYKKLAVLPGARLEIRVVATKEEHERWRKDPTQVPGGCEVVANDQPLAGEYEYLSGPTLLIRRDSVLKIADIQAATVQQSTDGGFGVGVTLAKTGADKFDAVASVLFGQKPPGLLAILWEGKILSKPVMKGPKLGGRVEIAGNFRREEADRIVAALLGGALPVPIGRPGTPGEPVEEKWVEPKK